MKHTQPNRVSMTAQRTESCVWPLQAQQNEDAARDQGDGDDYEEDWETDEGDEEEDDDDKEEGEKEDVE